MMLLVLIFLLSIILGMRELAARMNRTNQKIEVLTEELAIYAEKPHKKPKSDPISDKIDSLMVQNRQIYTKLDDLSQQRIQNYPPQQPYVGLQADINKIMIAMVSLPGKIQHTHNKLDEVLIIWRKILETKKPPQDVRNAR